MQIIVFTTDGELLSSLANSAPNEPAAPITVGKRQRIPGAFETYWQLAVDVGLISAPISVFCNMIASWLFEAVKGKPAAPPPQVKLVIRNGGKPIDIELTLDNVGGIKLRLEAALTDADF